MRFIMFFLVCGFVHGASNEVKEAKKSIEALIGPLLVGSNKPMPKEIENFSVDGCDKTKIKWMDVLLMRQEASLHYKFKKGCDIQGDIAPRVFKSFPISLALRNLKSFDQVNTQNTVTADLAQKPILNLAMRDGILTGKTSKVKFEADYRVQINPMAKDPVEKNLGGELRITEINGKKESIKEKILVK